MAHLEPMDVDMDGDMNKENSFHHSNVPCTEKGYEELDVSELNMKLRYSTTPAASPMSKSYTAYADRNIDDSLCNNDNLTRSLNSTITNDSIKSFKSLPLQNITTDQIVDNRNSILRQLESTITDDNHVTVTISGAPDDDNLSLPSTSSSAIHTPEATTPTNISKEEGSPIIRGLKSVFNMFRSSQSPIPSAENHNLIKQEISLHETDEDRTSHTLASTPVSAQRSRDGSMSKRNSPHKDSIIFNDDLETELQWKEETVLFAGEKVPLHKLFPQTKPTQITSSATPQIYQKQKDNLNSTVEYMDISCNNSMMNNTLTETKNINNAGESDGEFVDCETTFTKNESQNDPETQKDPLSCTLETVVITKDMVVNENILDDNGNESILTIEEENSYVVESEQSKQNTTAPNVNTFDVTREMVEENALVNENVEIENMPVTDSEKTLDILYDVKINDHIMSENLHGKEAAQTIVAPEITGGNIADVYKCGIPESVAALMEGTELTDNAVSILPMLLPRKIEEPSILVVMENVNENLAEKSSKICDEMSNSITVNINATSLVESKTPCKETVCNTTDALNESFEPEILSLSDKEEQLAIIKCKVNISQNASMEPNEVQEGTINSVHKANLDDLSKLVENVCNTTDMLNECFKPETLSLSDKEEQLAIIKCEVNESQNASMDPKEVEGGTINSVHKASLDDLAKLPLENSADMSMSTPVLPVLEMIIECEKQANDLDTKSIEIVLPERRERGETYIPTLKPENTPLSYDDDFEKDLETNKDVSAVETSPAMQPDVLDSIKTDSTETLDETLAKIIQSNIENPQEDKQIAQLELPISTDNNDLLNETNDIVNSLTEMIGDLPNTSRSECMLEQSHIVEPMDVSCADEKHVLPDLVNQTINMTVESDTEPEETNHIQSVVNNKTTEVINDSPDVPEIIANAIEQQKPSYDKLEIPVPKNTTEQSNDSNNINKEHSNGTPIEYSGAVPKESVQEESLLNKVDIIKEKELPADAIPVCEIKKTNNVPMVDEELVVSENNSPYVSVIAETEKQIIEENLEKIDIPITTTAEAPSSPPIRSKGYNFNFDEMDDPFATKTKIIQSLPFTPSKPVEPESEAIIESNKVVPNRRRSQAPERKRPLNKNKFNTTFDANRNSNSSNKQNKQINEVDSNSVPVGLLNNTAITMDINETLTKIEVTNYIDSTQVLDKMPEEFEAASLEKYLSNITPAELSTEIKSSVESVTTTTSEVKTSSSEQSTYYSTAASSSDSSLSRNVFNLPEIGDTNFNPFATKSKMRQSPPLDFESENPFATRSKMRSSPDSSLIVSPSEETEQNIKTNMGTEDKMDTELMEKDTFNVNNVTSSSKGTDDKNLTSREVNTEDEDTEEGPFLEAEDAIDKLLALESENDMMQFNEPTQAIDENVDGGELFIDAEAFEFLLNKHQSNVVADSGKESLFLKFDPLFSQRISSDGVLAALNKVQKRQSTPTKPIRPSLRNEASPIAGPSTFNTTYDGVMNITQESNDEANITVAKPMMVVTPAVNPAVTPRNKSITPPRSNRRSVTFTSPAMAVIDRLLSLSGNSSLVGHETTITHATREHHEADLALTQLRELLAEKEINVYELRSESKELKDRLSIMETQVKILEADGQDRLNKINELNERLAEKNKVNKSMAAVVEEYERTIASLIAETEQDKKRNAEERIRLINERDEQTAHLASMEVSFSDLHSKYEKSKQVILSCKANEETCKKSNKDFEENLTKLQKNYELLKQHATSKLNHANQELQKMNKAHESDVLKLNAMIKRKDMHITSLEETLAQKTKANEELTAICDELINKVG